MTYASVCTGIATDRLAFPESWECAWTSEIADFPSRLLKHYYPETPNLGDMRAIAHKKAFTYGFIRTKPVGLLVGGTPCQSFSVAGKRGGMDDHRGNLALTFARLAGILRPRWILWENVPGVLSSGAGRDFGAFLGALEKRGYHLAYRTLDAQWFGVPQRRRRVYVVGYLGDWRRAAAVLFDSASLRGNPPTRESERQEIAGMLGASAHGRGWRADLDTSGAYIPELAGAQTAATARLADSGDRAPDLIAHTLTAHGSGRRNPTTETFIHEIAHPLLGKGNSSHDDSKETYIPELSHCLTGGGFDASEDGSGRGTPLVAQAFNLRAASGGSSRSYIAQAIAENQRGEVRMTDVSPSLGLGGGKPGQGYPSNSNRCSRQAASASRMRKVAGIA